MPLASLFDRSRHFVANIPQGAFVAAPVGGLLWAFGAFALRLAAQFAYAKYKGHAFTALDRPAYLARDSVSSTHDDDEYPPAQAVESEFRGKFF